jgi:trehalose synthase
MNLELRRLAGPLQKLKVLHVSATRVGGGVAELLQSLVPNLNELGINADWFVPEFSQEFFVITKKFHNALQGLKQDITLDEIGFYLDTVRDIKLPDADLYVIHDPQVLALEIDKPKIWRCHIQTEGYYKPLMDILLPYINSYNAAIWTDASFVPNRVNIPMFTVSPCIDPLAIKNQTHSGRYAQAQLEIPNGARVVSAVSRFDIHKNQERIIEAFKKVDVPDAMLVILGNFANDDPEGGTLYAELRKNRASDIRIRALDDVRLVGSLLAVSDVFIHVSTKEGFGLVVTEAMLAGNPVIGSNVGGIPHQVLEGYTGWLVEPKDVEAMTHWMTYALLHPEETKRLGTQARNWTMKNFTITELVKDHLIIYQTIMNTR